MYTGGEKIVLRNGVFIEMACLDGEKGLLLDDIERVQDLTHLKPICT